MLNSVIKAAAFCIANRIIMPDALLEDLRALGIDVKALQDYSNSLHRVVLTYVHDLQTKPLHQVSNFAIDFANVIERQLPEAWRLGMRENNVIDMLEEWQLELDVIIASERARIPAFAEFIARAAFGTEKPGQAMQIIQSRLDLWINRYQDVINIAIMRSAEEKTKLEWIYGDTEHCPTCLELNGIVLYAREWELVGVQPQNPPNDMLACGGWRCGCRKVPTDKRHTRDGLLKVERIIGMYT